MEEPACIICGSNETKNLIAIKKKAISTLTASSKKRFDGKYKIFEKKESIAVHKYCQANYNNSQYIEAFRKKIKENQWKLKRLIKKQNSLISVLVAFSAVVTVLMNQKQTYEL